MLVLPSNNFSLEMEEQLLKERAAEQNKD